MRIKKNAACASQLPPSLDATINIIDTISSHEILSTVFQSLIVWILATVDTDHVSCLFQTIISCAINGERIAKHNHVRDAIFAAASQAALGPRKEPAGLLPGSDDRPADVLLPFWANGKDAALDVSVVNPLQQQLVGQVAREGEKGVQHAFNIKVGKYSERCEAEGIVFIPLVVDTFGGWHKDSLEVITKLGRQVSRQTGKEEDEIVRQLRQRVAILLVRDNVNMFDSRTPSYPQAVIDADVDINV